MRRRTPVLLALAAILAVAVAGCGISSGSGDPPRPVAKEANCGIGTKCNYLGVAAVRVSKLGAFEQLTRVKLTMVETYMTFGTPVDTGDVVTIMNDKAMPVIQLNPYNLSLKAIAAGRYDRYLKKFGTELAQFGQRVVVSFAAEANGTWYSWACTHTSAAVYLAAWRHVHDVVDRYDHQVIWMWDVNATYATAACTLQSRWPGAAYVNWVGVDGYLRNPGDTFDQILARTITEVHSFSGEPVLIAETGVPDVPAAVPWLKSIFTESAMIPYVIGIVYFDYATAAHNYRLEHDPAALGVFTVDGKAYQSRARS
jgi:mannan endo-1,4-beta-mannosidase